MIIPRIINIVTAVKPPKLAMNVIVINGSHNPILHNCSNPESLIDAEISVTPRNFDARFTSFSPNL